FLRLSRKSCQKIRIGLAINIDEYVPTMMPTTSAKENPLRTCPPKRYSDTAVRNVSPDVKMVRLNVWLTLRLIRDSRGSRRRIFRFSRIRSNTTIVSFIEYPTSVSRAATTVKEISL